MISSLKCCHISSLIFSSILFDHAEVSLHDTFGDSLYWQARRSMRFNTALRNIANDFRKQYLNSSDESDRTFLPDDWRDEKVKLFQNFITSSKQLRILA